MKYEVEISDTAWADVDEAFEWLSQRAPQAAGRWRIGLLEAIQQLESRPLRCSLAPESAYFNRPIRQLLYGKRQHKYRVLFTVNEGLVVVVRVRHGAQRPLGEK